MNAKILQLIFDNAKIISNKIHGNETNFSTYTSIDGIFSELRNTDNDYYIIIDYTNVYIFKKSDSFFAYEYSISDNHDSTILTLQAAFLEFLEM